MSINDVNQRLLKIFGLEGQRVTSLTAHTEVDAIPTLTTKRLLINVDGQDVRVIEQVFDLQLRQEKPAQPECEAMVRVNAWIEAEYGRCVGRVSQAFTESFERMGFVTAEPFRPLLDRRWVWSGRKNSTNISGKPQ